MFITILIKFEPNYIFLYIKVFYSCKFSQNINNFAYKDLHEFFYTNLRFLCIYIRFLINKSLNPVYEFKRKKLIIFCNQ